MRGDLRDVYKRQGYEGDYNFFNVEAYQSGSLSPTEMGLRYASESGSYGRPWNTVEKSIMGGAQNYGDNYVDVYKRQACCWGSRPLWERRWPAPAYWNTPEYGTPELNF